MRHITAGILNIDQPELTINVMEKLANLSEAEWAVQLILVDNGSQPDKLQVLSDWFATNQSHFSEVLFITSSVNQGVTGGRNIILKLTTTNRILILDNDVILPDDSAWLETLWQRLEDHPNVAIVGPTLVFPEYPDIIQVAGLAVTEQGRVGYLERGVPVADIPSEPVEVFSAPAACWLIRREAQEAIGLFDEVYNPAQYEDVDFSVRLSLAGWKVLADRSVTIQHIENVTTRNLADHPFARLTVKQAMVFRKKWADILPQIATISDEEIYWAPIPRTNE